eukprot:TRINITY_DN13903_c0_g1_i18.p1 TRINITY_DN13903_c0_g1~~TRINITY_DN13903_c0_g1_i18.p1  ORF type:complete len:432 (-),score=120.21 TRINITY_DN13903_c0_g1_i18:46-1197(-)
MNVVLFLIPLLTLVSTQAAQKLISSFVLVNVGSSSPHHPLPNNKWSDWNVHGPSELTGVGMREQYMLGKELRRRCDEDYNLLSDANLYNQIMLRSIDHNNTIESTVSFLRGFLRNQTVNMNEAQREMAKPGLDVSKEFYVALGNAMLPYGMNTLPFHTYYPHEEDLFDSCSCPKANKLIADSFSPLKNEKVKNAIVKYEAKFVDIIKSTYRLSGNDVVFPNYIKAIESIIAMTNHYMDTKLTADQLKLVQDFASELYAAYKAGNREANSYRAIPILSFATDVFNATSKSHTKTEMYKAGFVFVYDDVMASFLSFVADKNVTNIPPSSIVTLNLVKDATNWDFVELYYNDEEVKITGCKGDCKFENFLEPVSYTHLTLPTNREV